jgi:hypothetical protein
MYYYIENINPKDNSSNEKIITTYNYIDENKFHNEIIYFIANFMYDFCSEKYGHDIKIDSYDDFCIQFCKIEDKIKYLENIFKVYYLNNNNWIEWNIDENKTEIYDYYQKLCIDK